MIVWNTVLTYIQWFEDIFELIKGIFKWLEDILKNRGRLLIRIPGPVPFGTCICSYVETILSWTCQNFIPYTKKLMLAIECILKLWKVLD